MCVRCEYRISVIAHTSDAAPMLTALTGMLRSEYTPDSKANQHSHPRRQRGSQTIPFCRPADFGDSISAYSNAPHATMIKTDEKPIFIWVWV